MVFHIFTVLLHQQVYGVQHIILTISVSGQKQAIIRYPKVFCKNILMTVNGIQTSFLSITHEKTIYFTACMFVWVT